MKVCGTCHKPFDPNTQSHAIDPDNVFHCEKCCNKLDMFDGWGLFMEYPGQWHIYPINEPDHLHDTKCPCNPIIDIENGVEIVTHNSFDGREIMDEVFEILNKPINMNQYRKKPVVITALKWDGSETRFQEIRAMGKDSRVTINKTQEGKLQIPTLEGTMTADLGDMIIKGVSGELYPCKPDIFEKSYESANESKDENLKTTGLTFGQALDALKAGKRVARVGWNGKAMFLVKAGGYSVELDKLRDGTHFTKDFLQAEGCTEFKIVPHIDMWAADKTYVSGWLASQTDMFAEDWMIL